MAGRFVCRSARSLNLILAALWTFAPSTAFPGENVAASSPLRPRNAVAATLPDTAPAGDRGDLVAASIAQWDAFLSRQIDAGRLTRERFWRRDRSDPVKCSDSIGVNRGRLRKHLGVYTNQAHREWIYRSGDFNDYVNKMTRLYFRLGIPERRVIEYFDGPHSINGKGTCTGSRTTL